MNPIQEFMTKARVLGDEQCIREAEARALKAENEAAELKAALAEMQHLKERYQLVVIDIMAALERHGLVQ